MEGRQVSSLRALVVGSGFGCRIQAPALRGAGFEVAGLVGADPVRTAQRAARSGIARSFIDLDEAIGQTGATVVAIATPPATHGPLTLAALARGCHVLCEKPFATNLAEARAMLEAAQRAGVVHMIGHEFRFVPQRALFGRAIREGAVGEPRFVSFVEFSDFLASYAANMPAWWFDPAAGGGWLGASGSHIIDQIRSEVGEFASVSAALPRVSAAAAGVEDSFVVRFQLANGAEGVIQQTSGALGPRSRLYRVAGTAGSLWTEGEAVWAAGPDGARELSTPAELALPEPPPASQDPRQERADWKRMTAVELAPYTQLCLRLKRAIQGDVDHVGPQPATFADGVACMAVIDAIRDSAAQGGALVKVAAA